MSTFAHVPTASPTAYRCMTDTSGAPPVTRFSMKSATPTRVPLPSNRLQHLRRLAYWLDEGIGIPGTRFRIGLDPILGLIPGVGDAAGALLGAAILMEAARRGVPRGVLVRITANLVLDAALGSVPLLGDLFDMAWKANVRNLALLEREALGAPATARADTRLVVLLGGAAVVVVATVVVGGAMLTWRLLRGALGGAP